MVFFTIAVLISILVKQEIFALFTCLLVWFFFLDIMPNLIFAGNLSLIISGGFNTTEKQWVNTIALLSPSMIRYTILSDVAGMSSALSRNVLEFVKLILYMLVALFCSYIAFLRRDIS
jgi:ABC-2 type transport system permease protein